MHRNSGLFPVAVLGVLLTAASALAATPPALTRNTFLGGAGQDFCGDIATDPSGYIYVAGWGGGWGVPIATLGDGSGFVAKLDPNGTLIWNTFLGGDCTGLAVDAGGNVYVTGASSVTWGAPLRAHAGSSDVFVAKLDGYGALVWNTFLGGADADTAPDVALDAGGSLFVTGTSDAGWGTPIRPWALPQDTFAAKLDAGGALLWNTFVPGNTAGHRSGVAADAGGGVYVKGTSDGTWGAPILNFVAGTQAAYVARFDAAGALLWNTFLGGDGRGVAADAGGNVYAVGTSSGTWGAPIRAFVGNPQDISVAKLSGSGALLWNTFVGGGTGDRGMDVAVDVLGDVYVVGEVGFDNTSVTKLDTNGAPLWDVFVGGWQRDAGQAVALDAYGRVYAAGTSAGPWGDPVRPFTGDLEDVFVAALIPDASLDPRSAAPDRYVVVKDAVLSVAAPGVLGNDKVSPGGSLTAIKVSEPAHGTLALGADGAFVYTPSSGYVGPDTFTYKANDGSVDTNVAIVTITVVPPNQPPVAGGQSVTTAQNTAVGITLAGSDGDGDALAYSVVSGPAHGTLSGTAPRLTYTPAARYYGPDLFAFSVNDGQTDSEVAIVTISVVPQVSLSEALDLKAAWETGGTSPWAGQLNVRHDGVDAAQSGPLADGQSSWLRTTVVGPKTVTFWWKTSSAAGDALSFFVDTTRLATRTGITGWQQESFAVGSGTHVVRWRFARNASGSAGMNAGFVDQVRITAPAP
jgi:hypothetical protein